MDDGQYLKSVDYRGQWRMPDSDEWVRGTLTYSRDQGVEVAIDAANQEDYFSRLTSRPSKLDIVHGEADYGLPITLLNCQYYAVRARVQIARWSASRSRRRMNARSTEWRSMFLVWFHGERAEASHSRTTSPLRARRRFPCATRRGTPWSFRLLKVDLSSGSGASRRWKSARRRCTRRAPYACTLTRHSLSRAS